MPPAIARVYTPRLNQDRLFHAIFKNHWHSFVAHFPDEIKPHHEKIVRRFMECGDPKEGFALVECPNCHESYFVPFSCKTRICNSCQSRRVVEWVDKLTEKVLIDVNHRHLVWTIPTELRHFFHENIWLLRQLLETSCKTAYHAYSDLGRPGIVAVLQTFGDKLNFNPHVHMLLTECQILDGFWSEALDLEEGMERGYIRPVKYVNFRHLNLLWQNRILALLVNSKHISVKDAAHLRSKFPHGFFVYQTEKAVSISNEETRKIAAYLMKPPVKENRIERYDRGRQEILFKFKVGVDGARRNVYKHETMSPFEFIRRVLWHILPFSVQKVRYYGIYSNKFRGKHPRNRSMSPSFSGQSKATWRTLLWRILEVDPLVCLKCGTEMKIMRVVLGREARNIGQFTKWKYCVFGRWRIDRRLLSGSPPDGMERRAA